MTENARPAPSFAWGLVLCLVGLDYFSTLAYLPSIAVEAADRLAPVAALGVVAITLLFALPIYSYVVGRSPHGQGATGLLERRVRGWFGKFAVLVLLGFVATDFVITRSLSTSDAAAHVIHNPFWKENVEWLGDNKDAVRAWFPQTLQGRFFDFWNEQLVLTVTLSVIGFGFWAVLRQGFTRGFLRLAAVVVVAYLGMTALVVGSGLYHLWGEPQKVRDWLDAVGQSTWSPADGTVNVLGLLAIMGLLAFPQMALGLSGFELSMTSASLVRGRPDDDPERPRGRIANTRKLLVAAVLIMGVFLLSSVFAVTLLVPRDNVTEGGVARFRTLAYLAHGSPMSDGEPATALNPLFGPWFGTVYDLGTALILCLAGASVTLGLRDLVPHYLARYGMQLQWAHKIGAILHLFNLTVLVVTVVFRASVSAQEWAYATSVLVLLAAASIAAFLDVSGRLRGSLVRWVPLLPLALVILFFLTMAGLTVVMNPSGLAIALAFILLVLATGFVSRVLRSTELRFEGFAFADEHTKARWDEICRLEFQVLVPHRPNGLTLEEKEAEVRERHRLGPDVPIIFVEVTLGDPSDFFHKPLMKTETEGGREIVRVSRCASVAHVLTAIGLAFREVGRPPEIHFGWSGESPITANVNFLLYGEGNVPWMVHELLRKAEPDPERRPRVVIG
jgi:hypothetical protein